MVCAEEVGDDAENGDEGVEVGFFEERVGFGGFEGGVVGYGGGIAAGHGGWWWLCVTCLMKCWFEESVNRRTRFRSEM